MKAKRTTKEEVEVGLMHGEDATELYQGAMLRLVERAYQERAEFPLSVTVTNVFGETWEAVITLTLTGDGSEFHCKHVDCGYVSLTFPLTLVATDPQGDIVAGLDVMLGDPPHDPTLN